jgi:hypothetical protein
VEGAINPVTTKAGKKGFRFRIWRFRCFGLRGLDDMLSVVFSEDGSSFISNPVHSTNRLYMLSSFQLLCVVTPFSAIPLSTLSDVDRRGSQFWNSFCNRISKVTGTFRLYWKVSTSGWS